MILTVTMNPSVDRLYLVERFVPEAVNRAAEARATAGGKGLNVARVAAALGEKVTVTGVLGGRSGAALLELLEPGVTPAFAPCAGETRSCINLRDGETGRHTELLEPGAALSPPELDAFLERYEALLSGCGLVVLSGSLPKGCPVDFYARLISLAKARGKPALLDTSRPWLEAGLGGIPRLIKPNADELAQLSGRPTGSLAGAAEAARALRDRGVGAVVVSLGKRGALALWGNETLRAKTPDIPVVNTVGCGDSMMAGMAVGLARGLPGRECLRMGMAAATANALTPSTGSIRASDYERLLNEITIAPFDGAED